MQTFLTSFYFKLNDEIIYFLLNMCAMGQISPIKQRLITNGVMHHVVYACPFPARVNNSIVRVVGVEVFANRRVSFAENITKNCNRLITR